MTSERRVTTFLDGLGFTEGPRWYDGRLWFSDFIDLAVMAADLNGNVEKVVDVPQQPSGLGWLPDGRLLVVSWHDGKIMRLDPGGLVEHAHIGGICNDMVVDATGRAYVGNYSTLFVEYVAENGLRKGDPNLPKTDVMRVDADGSVHLAAGGLDGPNGSVITPDGKTLIVAESLGERLTAFEIGVDGELSGKRVWAEMPGTTPDGIALDSSGAVWVANAYVPECLRVAEGGQVLDRVETSQPCFACVLGGPGRSTLFMLTAPGDAGDPAMRDGRLGRIEAVGVDVPGAGIP